MELAQIMEPPRDRLSTKCINFVTLKTSDSMSQDSSTYSAEVYAVKNLGEKYKYRNLCIKGINKKVIV